MRYTVAAILAAFALLVAPAHAQDVPAQRPDCPAEEGACFWLEGAAVQLWATDDDGDAITIQFSEGNSANFAREPGTFVHFQERDVLVTVSGPEAEDPYFFWQPEGNVHVSWWIGEGCPTVIGYRGVLESMDIDAFSACMESCPGTWPDPEWLACRNECGMSSGSGEMFTVTYEWLVVKEPQTNTCQVLKPDEIVYTPFQIGP